MYALFLAGSSVEIVCQDGRIGVDSLGEIDLEKLIEGRSWLMPL
jgi:hypothetical protein